MYVAHRPLKSRPATADDRICKLSHRHTIHMHEYKSIQYIRVYAMYKLVYTMYTLLYVMYKLVYAMYTLVFIHTYRPLNPAEVYP